MEKSRIKKNDKVMVTTGKDRGKVGKVLRVILSKNRIVVEKVNMAKRHTKGNPYQRTPSGIVEKELPIDISNVMLMCMACTKATRVGYRFTEEGKKVRFCKKCNEILD